MPRSTLKKYTRAKVTQKRIKLSFFLTPMGFLDQFNLLGTVYAQSGGGGGATSNTAGGSTGGVGTGSSTGGTSGTNSGTGGN